MALAFARTGAHVGIGYRANESAARRTLDAIQDGGGCATLHRFDVRDRAATEHALAELASTKGGLEVVVNNAGIAGDDLALSMSDEKWNQVIAVNLTGAFNCARAAGAIMMRVRRGCIINIGSVAGLRAHRGQINYAASKAGLLAVTRTLAIELGRFGVRVNAVVPGLIAAGMGERMNPNVVQSARAGIPLERLGTAEEVAAVVVFLASPDAGYITGQAIVVDGGMSA
jgi:3-oxoacyl-[acyl-carrier protein] reductase